MKVKFMVGVGYGSREEIVELSDNLTEDEIYKELDEWMYEYLDSGYEIIEENDDED